MPELKEDVVSLRLSPNEKALFREASEAKDMKMADWMRRELKQVAWNQLGRSPGKTNKKPSGD